MNMPSLFKGLLALTFLLPFVPSGQGLEAGLSVKVRGSFGDRHDDHYRHGGHHRWHNYPRHHGWRDRRYYRVYRYNWNEDRRFRLVMDSEIRNSRIVDGSTMVRLEGGRLFEIMDAELDFSKGTRVQVYGKNLRGRSPQYLLIIDGLEYEADRLR